MRLAATVLSIVTLVLALPLLAETASNPTASAAGAEPSGDTGATLLVPLEIGAPAAVEQAGSCPSGQYFLLLVTPPSPSNPQCNKLCKTACEDAGGTVTASFFDRVDCNCFCCAG